MPPAAIRAAIKHRDTSGVTFALGRLATTFAVVFATSGDVACMVRHHGASKVTSGRRGQLKEQRSRSQKDCVVDNTGKKSCLFGLLTVASL